MGRAEAGGEIKWRRMDQGSAVPIGSFIEPVDLFRVLSDVMGLIQRGLRLQRKIRAQMPSA